MPTRRSPFESMPMELLDACLRLACVESVFLLRTLRLVNHACNCCLLPVLFARVTYPRSPRFHRESLSFLAFRPHITDAVRSIIITSIPTLSHCLRFIALCNEVKPIHTIEWALQGSSAYIIPSPAYASISFMSTVVWHAETVSPDTVSWVLANARPVRVLKLDIKCARRRDGTPRCKPSLGPIACALQEFEYCPRSHVPYRRLLGDPIFCTYLNRASSLLVILKLTILPGELGALQSLLQICSLTLESLDIRMIFTPTTGTFFQYSHPGLLDLIVL
ncbi:hypothetical protein BDZ89DRAFT_1129844 [Hymenopellis radicata]|nr:hypothetical protein BDZ89DRAFT_1129844 [Hymenopellis radicata]